MATPTATVATLPGALGEILLDIRTGDRRSDRPAVLILPGFKGFKDFGPFPSLGERLARAGFTSVAISVSGCGVDRDGEFTLLNRFARNTISAELADLHTVLGALDAGQLGVPRPTSIGLVGHSRGGGVGLIMAGQAPRISALATWAAVGRMDRWTPEQVADWRRAGVTMVVNSRTGQELPLHTDLLDDAELHADAFNLAAIAARLNTPWLLAHGTVDETVPVTEGEALAAASGGRAETLWLEGALHGFGGVHPFAGMNRHLTRLFDATVAHFSRHLR
ncbi:MAG: alpha/beta fold hydrolase [Gemmatimonadota bacterium]|nr:alpha/beta fold hydrolase [Gemmatimonadota bacterium]